MQLERASIQMIVDGLGVQPEAVRYACNRMRIKVDADGWFSIAPLGTPQRTRWHAILASRPKNGAERLRWDLGHRSRLMVGE